jgi:hypothetical protein
VSALEASGDDAGARKLWREIAELYKTRATSRSRARSPALRRARVLRRLEREQTTPSLLLTRPTHGPDGAPTFDPGDDDDIDLELDDAAPSKPTPNPKRAGIVEKNAPGAQLRSAPAPRSDPPATPSTSPAELLAEARVSLEFGDPAEATRLAKLVLEADPDSRDARKILADVERGAAGAEVELEVAVDPPEIERSSRRQEPRRPPPGKVGKPGSWRWARRGVRLTPGHRDRARGREDRDRKFASSAAQGSPGRRREEAGREGRAGSCARGCRRRGLRDRGRDRRRLRPDPPSIPEIRPPANQDDSVANDLDRRRQATTHSSSPSRWRRARQRVELRRGAPPGSRRTCPRRTSISSRA